MKNGYQIVSESVDLTEGIVAGTLGIAGAIGIPIGAWYLNKVIRTKKVLSLYPTPSHMKAKLMQSNNPQIHGVANQLSDDMSPEVYAAWVARKTNPRMSAGKAILLWLLPLTIPYELGKAAVHATEDGDTILNRAINKGRIYR